MPPEATSTASPITDAWGLPADIATDSASKEAGAEGAASVAEGKGSLSSVADGSDASKGGVLPDGRAKPGHVQRDGWSAALGGAGIEGSPSEAGEAGAEGAADPAEAEAIRKKAWNLGWRPLDKFKGDPKNWVDAEEYIRRGESALPLIKAHNQKLEAQVIAQRNELATLRDSIKALQETHADLRRRAVENVKQKLRAELIEARQASDHEKELQIQDQLEDLKAQETKTKTEASPPIAVDPAQTPEFKAWQAANPWYGANEKATSLALRVGEALRKDPRTSHLKGMEFYNAVTTVTQRIWQQQAAAQTQAAPTTPAARQTPRTSRSSAVAVPTTKTWAALPPEARAAADTQAKRLVGPGKMFSTMEAWREYYTKEYFEQD